MTRRHLFCYSLLLTALVLFQVLLTENMEEILFRRNCFSYQIALANMRDYEISGDCADALKKASGGNDKTYYELLAMYFAAGGTLTDPDEIKSRMADARRYHPDELAQIAGYLQAIWEDVACFPVGSVPGNPDATVSFENSWMQSRTFGGERGHEGTDVMPSVDERGIYPIYSMTDGIIEKMGWLRLGGYRIGIRSPAGAYFYYAHLSAYADGWKEGDAVKAGDLLGYMGDTGYSDVEGTTGNFGVHLHLGIYVNDPAGCELSVNSYPILRALWEKGHG